MGNNFNSRRRIRNPRHNRSGLTVLELLVSAVLLMTVMTFVTTLCLQVRLVCRDIDHHRLALNELSNHLETLTQLTPAEAKQFVKSLTPSPECASTLAGSTLSGIVTEDSIGTRVQLELDWKRRNPGQPVVLSGWIQSNNGAQP
jgi:hypothetical protein